MKRAINKVIMASTASSSFKEVITRKLECPMCLTVFTEPKALSCLHSFCKGCLQSLLRAQIDQQRLPCPVCKEITPVLGGDVNQLQTNQGLSALVDDVKNRSQMCTSCEAGKESPAVSFCQECDMDMCTPCNEVHGQWKRFAGHNVVSMIEMISGKASLMRRRKCKKHPTEDEECFCADCRKHVCFRCGMLEHAHAGHRIQEAGAHEEVLIKNIQELKLKAGTKKTAIVQYIEFIEKQRERLSGLLNQMHGEIDQAYDESVQHLSNRKDLLKGKVHRRIEELSVKLQGMEEESRERIVHVDAVEELVSNGMRIPLKKKALAAHDNLCEELEKILARDGEGFDYENPKTTAKEGERLRFVRNVGANELELGQVREAENRWVLGQEAQLPTKDCMNGMAATPDGMVAIGSQFGGIHLFSADGQYGTALNSIEVRAIACMSDGRYVVRDDDNNILLFTRQLAKLGSRFGTLSDADGGPGGLAVDSGDNVYIGYMKTRNIQVFPPTGGRASREIICEDFMPMQIFAVASSKMLVVRASANSARVIDPNGRTKHSVSKEGKIMAYPAACLDGSIIVAWVKHESGLISIDKYTNELNHVKTLIANQKIQKPEKRNWYYLQQYRSGEIAFSTTDRLYIFTTLME